MAFFHGVRTTESPTSILPAAPCEAAMPVYFGVAPVHRTDDLKNKINYPILCNAYDDAVMSLGYDDDWAKWTLCENIYAQFALFATSPCVFVNVFDPSKHKTNVATERATLVGGECKTANKDVILSTLVVKDQAGSTTYNVGTDYTVAYDEDYYATIVRLESGTITSDTAQLTLTYDYADPSQVDKDDIIGGINAQTGDEEGLEVIERVYPVNRKVPGLIAATGWSEDVEVAAVMATKAGNINGLFRAVAILDIPVSGDDAPTIYTDVPAYKNEKNLVDSMEHVLWPMLALGETEYRYSSQFTALIQQVTQSIGNGVPYVSPSNHNIQCDRLITGELNARKEVSLSLTKANYLNENGITTALNFSRGWTAWGNRNACYPGTTDTKDVFLTNRLMFNWLEAEFILSLWQKVDEAITRRLIETVEDSFNDRLNGLTSQGALLGGRIEFRKEDNPVSSVIDGKIAFKLYITPPPPAEEISGDFELDPDYFDVLYSE